jgi:hypothetical protein
VASSVSLDDLSVDLLHREVKRDGALLELSQRNSTCSPS